MKARVTPRRSANARERRTAVASTLTKAQVEELRGKLERERARILRVLRTPALTTAAPDQDTEFEEAAQRETELGDRLEVEARERALLVEVERALAKVEGGGYGVGEQTGEPISYERLAAVPWAREPLGD
jgi:DnaK suppressor protein